jgi:hypothetical protein
MSKRREGPTEKDKAELKARLAEIAGKPAPPTAPEPQGQPGPEPEPLPPEEEEIATAEGTVHIINWRELGPDEIIHVGQPALTEKHRNVIRKYGPPRVEWAREIQDSAQDSLDALADLNEAFYTIDKNVAKTSHLFSIKAYVKNDKLFLRARWHCPLGIVGRLHKIDPRFSKVEQSGNYD